MAVDIGDASFYSSSLHALLVDPHRSLSEKCELAALILNEAADDATFGSLASSLLPSLVHLHSLAPTSPSRDSLLGSINSLHSTARLAQIHDLLVNQPSFTSSLVKSQQSTENTWKSNLSNSSITNIDVTGATLDQWSEQRATLDPPALTSFNPTESLEQGQSMVNSMLVEMRRLLLLSQTLAKSFGEGENSESISSLAGTTSTPGSMHPNATITLESIFSSQMSVDAVLSTPFVALSALQNFSNSDASMDVDAQTTGSHPDGESSLPVDVLKLVLSLLQVEHGDYMAQALIMNSFVCPTPFSGSTSLPSSNTQSQTTILEHIILSLVDYLHVLKMHDCSRLLISSESPLGPFATSTGVLSEKGLLVSNGSRGWPRRSSFLPSKGPAMVGESEAAVVSRINALLDNLALGIFSGPIELLEKAGLQTIANKFCERLARYGLLPGVQARLVFGSNLYSTESPLTLQESEWVQCLATGSKIRIEEWKQFLRIPGSIQGFILAKLTTLPSLMMEHETSFPTSSVDEEIALLKNFLKSVALSLVSLSIPATSSVVTSLNSAVSRLIALLSAGAQSEKIDEALTFAIVSSSVLSYYPAQQMPNGEQNFVLFSGVFQLLSQLSNSAILVSLPSIALLRLIQLLHHSQRIDLIAHCIEHVTGVSIDVTWLFKGVSAKFDASPSSSTFMTVSFTDAWLWSAPIATLSHLTLTNLYYSTIETSFESSPGAPSLVKILEDDTLFASKLSPSISKSLSPISTSSRLVDSEKEDSSASASSVARWRANSDPWLQWLVLRLLLILCPSADFERYSTTVTTQSFGGNQDGVGESLWKMCERLSAFVCSSGPSYTRPISMIALDTFQCFSQLCLEGTQRFWSSERLPEALKNHHSANFAQCINVSTSNLGHSVSSSNQNTICSFSSSSVMQVLLISCLAFARAPAPNTSAAAPAHPSPSITPSIIDASENIQDAAMAIAGRNEGTSMKRPEFLSWVSRHAGVALPRVWSTSTQLTPERKRRMIAQFYATLDKASTSNLAASPGKAVQLSRSLYVCILLPYDPLSRSSTSSLLRSTNSFSGISRSSLRMPQSRVCVSMFYLLRKGALSAFPHLIHFSQLIQISSPSKNMIGLPYCQRIPVDFGFLGASDYRKLVANQPLLAQIDFASLQHLANLERFITSSTRDLAQFGPTGWDEKKVVAVLEWAMIHVSLERTLQAAAYAMLSTNISRNIENRAGEFEDDLSSAIDKNHEKLISNPQLLFTFDLHLLRRPTFFNFIFYYLISYYWCLSKIDVSATLEATQQLIGNTAGVATSSNALDEDSDSEDEEESSMRKKNSADDDNASISIRKPSDSANGDAMETNASSSPSSDASMSELTDPFHIRGVRAAKRAEGKRFSKSSLASLNGESQMSVSDAELLKRLEDCALVHLLIDMMLFVEDAKQQSQSHPEGDKPGDVVASDSQNGIDSASRTFKGPQGANPARFAIELGVKEELRVQLCRFIQQLFVNDGPLMNLVHQQGYPSRAIAWLVDGVPAMHFCLELAPPLLARAFQRIASSDTQITSSTFPIHLTAWVIKRYPTPRSMEMASYLFDLFRSAGKSLPVSVWSATLRDLARIVLAFPSLSHHLVDLVQIHGASSLPNSSGVSDSTRTSHLANSSSPSYGSSYASFNDREGSGKPAHVDPGQILEHVFSLLSKGQAVAPYLKS